MQKTCSLLLKAVVIVFAVLGTIFSITAGGDAFMGGTRVLMYFTIQSNLALAAICLIGAILQLRGKEIPYFWVVIKLVGTLSITLTGAVFAFVLAPTMGAKAWNRVNTYTHVIVPLAAVADFFVSLWGREIRKKDVFYTVIPPILYVFYAAVGYVRNWEFAKGINYPYFFLNWGSPAGAFGFSSELPFMGCMWWILLLTVLVLLVACAYTAILNLGKKHRKAGRA